MDMLTSAIIEAGIDTLSALTDVDPTACIEHQPLENGFRKFVFFLKKRPDEDDLEVRINARISLFHDCNQRSIEKTDLEKTAAGYYRIDQPVYTKTRMGCKLRTYTETDTLYGDGYTLPYDSSTPIVIHAFAGFDPREDVYVGYDVIHKSMQPRELHVSAARS
ncbi:MULTISPECIES: ecotin family protein [Pseudomonas]|uniref:Uncharacterized protein n=2 Tax=Pseudomonas gingeri TaxID=117681 RepID=A0A7Y7XZ28_9PSED|nr:ecotin family protein [Pseudomonas gingeri]NVZ26329.1 hypothetical protein [Pseudomonas gingeri]NWC14686.1 hypothetical protein [Pseudomonas gingeri]NWE44398.1 hypothetical protein [Pseudomonas gingeri]NWE67205.1 hypothetical protein [Pseudomonas gingeri]